MKIVVLVCRVLLGLMFVVFGLNGFHQFIHMQQPQLDATHAALVGSFMAAMVPSGWMHVNFVFQLLGGLLILFGRTAPLGLCFLAPVLVNILCFHILLMGGAGIGAGLFAVLLWLVVFYGYRTHFAGIFSTAAQPAV